MSEALRPLHLAARPAVWAALLKSQQVLPTRVSQVLRLHLEIIFLLPAVKGEELVLKVQAQPLEPAEQFVTVPLAR